MQGKHTVPKLTCVCALVVGTLVVAWQLLDRPETVPSTDEVETAAQVPSSNVARRGDAPGVALARSGKTAPIGPTRSPASDQKELVEDRAALKAKAVDITHATVGEVSSPDARESIDRDAIVRSRLRE